MYGATFWLNSHGNIPSLPRDAYMARGGLGSTSIIVPSRDLVIVILTGNSLPAETGPNTLKAIEFIVAALPRS
jgi:hypothetical protein